MRRLVGSFTDADHPDLIFMSGGEPFLKPDLVQDLSDQAHQTSTRATALSGMFFARGHMPTPIRRAIASLDHFSASIDEFHEREVPRDRVFAALSEILDLVAGVSLHVAAHDESYLDDLLPHVRRVFGDRIPMLVNTVRPMGRARDFVADAVESPDAGPCELAAWPLMDYDGTVYACCRPSIGRHYQPSHLVLGHASRDTWAVLGARSRGNPVLRAVRAIGPVQAAHLNGLPVCGTVCETCVALPAGTSIPPGVETVALQLVSRQRPRDLALRWGAGRHAGLVESGWPA